jgi:NAD(P)-dependent dehydrogenase (short-subunit alcohol dehydrogenase family)
MKKSSLLLLLTKAAFATVALRAVVRSVRYMHLQNRTVLVTGGSRGLGLDIAREALRRGARVAICARDEAELAEASRQLGRNVLTAVCDVADVRQVSDMINFVMQRCGTIDVLINNAGVMTVAPLEHMSPSDFQQAMQTHFTGPLNVTLALLPTMRHHRSGRIVNIASIGGKIPVPHMVPYCASKFALVGLSESLRTELTRYGIYVTTVVPGLMRTGSPGNVDVKGQNRKEYAWFVAGDVTPIVSIDPMRVASRILDAAEYGEAEVTLPLAACAAAKLHGLLSGLSTEVISLINRILPSPGGIGRSRRKGSQSDSWMVPQIVRQRNREAAMRHNEMGTSA